MGIRAGGDIDSEKTELLHAGRVVATRSGQLVAGTLGDDAMHKEAVDALVLTRTCGDWILAGGQWPEARRCTAPHSCTHTRCMLTAKNARGSLLSRRSVTNIERRIFFRR